MPPPWTPEVFVDDDGNEPFTRFAESLSDFAFVALDAAIRFVLAVRGMELARTEWLKALGNGLHEFRIRHDADEIARMFGVPDDQQAAAGAGQPEPVLLRVFVHFHGDKVVLLLSGYDKGDDSSAKRQARAITTARKHLAAWRVQEARRKAAGRPGGPRRGSQRKE